MDGVLEAFHDNSLVILDPEYKGILQRAISTYSSASGETKESLVVTLSDIASHFSSVLKSVLKSETVLDSNNLLQYKNVLQSIVTFINGIVSKAEKEEVESVGQAVGEGSSVKGKKGKRNDKHWDWPNLKEELIISIISLFECPLARLWGLDYPDEDFIQLVTGIVYDMLENPGNGKAALSELRENIFKLISILVIKYNHGVGAGVRIMHLLQKFEHLGVHLAVLMSRLIDADRTFKSTAGQAVFANVIQEIARVDARTFTTDSTAARYMSMFLSECSERIPVSMISLMPFLLHHLGGEAYAMRNGIVHACAHILARGFSNDEENSQKGIERENLLEILEERFADVNAFVRAKTCQAWSFLVSERNIIPLKHLPRITQSALGRLKDKSALVRKGALHLLTNLLQYNPYGATLSLSTMELKLKQIEKRLGLEDKDGEKKGEEEEEGEGEGERKEDAKQDEVQALSEMLDSLLLIDDKDQSEETRRRLDLLLDYYGAGCGFTKQLHIAVVAVGDLMGSKNVSDVTESINFFMTCKQFGIEAVGLRKMLLLIFSKDVAIVNAVMEAFKSLYLVPTIETPDKKLYILSIARGLVALACGATLSELTALEHIMQNVLGDNSLPVGVVDALWAIFTGKAPSLLATHGVLDAAQIVSTDEAEKVGRRSSFLLISMLAGGDPSLIRQKVDVIADNGLKFDVDVDYELVRISCLVLSKLTVTKGQKVDADTIILRPDHPLLQQISSILKATTTTQSKRDKKWFGMAEECLNAIYRLCSAPDILCGDVLKCVVGPLLLGTPNEKNDDQDISQYTLAQLVFLAGHCALRQLVFVEEKQAQYMRMRASVPERGGKKGKGGLEEAFNAGTVDDADNEILQEIQEKEIVNSNLLSLFGPIIVEICESIGGTVTDPDLCTSASLSLCKFMTVSKTYCETHLRLLFTLLKNSQDSSVRADIAVALGDLAFRFPNLVEPYTSHIYARLRDPDVRVRKNTLMVLTHLILNDMIKVKGQIAEMATCIVDSDSRISDLARLFFVELSNKGNAIYNILPDVISHLSTGEGAIGQDEFKEIMKFLLGFIKKERQAESLMEKLCHRFSATLDVIQWQNLAFCQTLLSFNEKSVRKLNDLFGFIAPSLYDGDVYSLFKLMMAKGKKFSKPESRQAVEDLELRIDAAHEQGSEDHRATAQALDELKTARAKGRKIMFLPPDPSPDKDNREEEEEDSEVELLDTDEEDEEEEEEEKVVVKRRGTQR